MLQPLCVVLVVLLWRYGCLALYDPVLAIGVFRCPLRGFGGAGVSLWLLGDACSGPSNVVFSLLLHLVCVVLVLLVWCYNRLASHVSLLAMACFDCCCNTFAWCLVLLVLSYDHSATHSYVGVLLMMHPCCVVFAVLV